MRILVVEDEHKIANSIKRGFEQETWATDVAYDGEEGYDMASSEDYDVIVLDLMLPKMDGFTLAGKIREKNSDIPILFLTARSTKEDRIYGLQLGADDYITKPFSIEELVLKIEVFFRRSKIVSANGKRPELIQLGRYTFDQANQHLTEGKKQLQLTYRETELLKYLADHSGQIVKREDILLNVWENDQYFSSRSLDVFISRLRKILKSEPAIMIENIHNIGYRLRIDR